METKSRYEVISDLEQKKNCLIRERESFNERITMMKKDIREMERDVEDKKEDLNDFIETVDEKKETINELIKSINESLDRFNSLNQS